MLPALDKTLRLETPASIGSLEASDWTSAVASMYARASAVSLFELGNEGEKDFLIL